MFKAMWGVFNYLTACVLAGFALVGRDQDSPQNPHKCPLPELSWLPPPPDGAKRPPPSPRSTLCMSAPHREHPAEVSAAVCPSRPRGYTPPGQGQALASPVSLADIRDPRLPQGTFNHCHESRAGTPPASVQIIHGGRD